MNSQLEEVVSQTAVELLRLAGSCSIAHAHEACRLVNAAVTLLHMAERLEETKDTVLVADDERVFKPQAKDELYRGGQYVACYLYKPETLWVRYVCGAEVPTPVEISPGDTLKRDGLVVAVADASSQWRAFAGVPSKPEPIATVDVNRETEFFLQAGDELWRAGLTAASAHVYLARCIGAASWTVFNYPTNTTPNPGDYVKRDGLFVAFMDPAALRWVPFHKFRPQLGDELWRGAHLGVEAPRHGVAYWSTERRLFDCWARFPNVSAEVDITPAPGDYVLREGRCVASVGANRDWEGPR